MSQSDVLALAKQGNTKAISALLGHYLEAEAVTAKVTQRDHCLYVLLEAEQIPDRASIAAMIHRRIVNLRLSNLTDLIIFGRRHGDRKAAWQESMALDTSASEAPPPQPEEPTPTPPTRSDASYSSLDNATLQAMARELLASNTMARDLLLSSPASSMDDGVNDSENNSDDDEFALSHYDLDLDETDDGAQEAMIMELAQALGQPDANYIEQADLDSETIASETIASETVASSYSDTESSDIKPLDLIQENSTLESLESASDVASMLDVEPEVPLNSDQPVPNSSLSMTDLEPPVVIDAPVTDPWETDGSTSATGPNQPESAQGKSAPSPESTGNSVAEVWQNLQETNADGLLKRPEAIVLLAWLSMVLVWQLYLALSAEDELPADQVLSTTRLAKRLGIHSQTLKRHRERDDFAAWSQDLDPEDIAWRYQDDETYIALT